MRSRARKLRSMFPASRLQQAKRKATARICKRHVKERLQHAESALRLGCQCRQEVFVLLSFLDHGDWSQWVFSLHQMVLRTHHQFAQLSAGQQVYL